MEKLFLIPMAAGQLTTYFLAYANPMPNHNGECKKPVRIVEPRKRQRCSSFRHITDLKEPRYIAGIPSGVLVMMVMSMPAHMGIVALPLCLARPIGASLDSDCDLRGLDIDLIQNDNHLVYSHCISIVAGR